MPDPVITIERLRSNLEALVGEMSNLLVTSAYSTLLRESRDCSYLFLGPDGEVVVLPDESFLHGPSYRQILAGIRRRFGAELAPGDVFVTNHPYDGGVPHTPDLAFVAPVHSDGRLVGFSASLAHKADMGGSVPGSASSGATDLHQEGFLLPLTRLRGTELDRDWGMIEAILAANVRESSTVIGDARAQLGVTRLGAQRAAEIVARYGAADSVKAMRAMVQATAGVVRREIGAWPDGIASATTVIDSDGVRLDEPVQISVTARVEGESVTLDYSGTAAQRAGPVNIPMCYSEAAGFYAVGSMLPLHTALNDGLREAVRLILPRGSLVNPVYPGPVGAATIGIYRLIDVSLEALGRLVPGGAVAHSGGTGGAMMVAYRAKDSEAALLQYEIFGSGFGASSQHDGESGVTVYATNLSLTSIEVLELQYPVRVRRFELIPDSGGAGRHRGGLSYRREYELLADAKVVRRADRVRWPSRGAAGGHDGRTGRFIVQRPGEAPEETSGIGTFDLPAGTVITAEGAGGGGYGDPRQRAAEDVQRDLARGYVSPRAAVEVYGYRGACQPGDKDER